MRLKTTLILLLVVGALLLVWRLKGPVVEPTYGPKPLAGAFPTDQTSRVELQLGTGEAAIFERKAGVWWLVDPFADRADRDALERFFNVVGENPRDVSDAHPDRKLLESLHLEPPRARVTLVAGDRSLRMRVGDRDPAAQFVWIKFEDDPALYRTGSNLANVIDVPRQEWRDKRFLAGDSALLRSVKLTRPGAPDVALVHEGADWRCTEPVQCLADGANAGKLANGTLLLTVKRFVAANPDEKTLVSAQIGSGPALHFDFGGRSLDVRFGASENGEADAPRFATDSERGHLFVVEGPGLAALRYPPKRFRDPEIVRVTTRTVEKIRIRRPGRAPDVVLEFRPTTRKFDVVEPFTAVADDSRSGALFSWLLDVSMLRAVDLPDEPGKPGDRGFLDRAELPKHGGGDPLDLLGFDRPDAVLEFRLNAENGITRDVAIEIAAPAGDGTVPVRRADKNPDSAYLVSEEQVKKILALDARQLLPPQWFPRDLNHVTSAEFSVAGRPPRTVARDLKAPPSSQFWSGDTPGNEFQQYLSKLTLPDSDAIKILARDAAGAADGLEPPAATIRLTLRDEAHPQVTVRIGKKDASGTTVLATIDSFPERNVVELPAWVVDDLTKLFP